MYSGQQAVSHFLFWTQQKIWERGFGFFYHVKKRYCVYKELLDNISCVVNSKTEIATIIIKQALLFILRSNP